MALVGACWPEMETRVLAGCALASNGDMGVCWAGVGKQWRHGCVGWVLISHGDGMRVVRVMISNGDGVCVVWVLISHVFCAGADQPWGWSVR